MSLELKEVFKGDRITNFVNAEDGEVLESLRETKIDTILVETPEQFAFIYSTVVGALKSLTGADVKMLTYICLKAEHNTNEIVLIKPFLEKLAKEVDLSMDTLRACIRHLKTQGIITPLGSGAYRINPNYYWKGDRQSRKQKMEYILRLEYINQ